MSTQTKRGTGSSSPLTRPGFDAFPEAKFLRPADRAGIVPRTKVIRGLRSARSSSIVSILAPAGYGKTMLLAGWDAADRRPFAWVTVDESDNDPAMLLRSIAFALDRIEPIGPEIMAHVASQASDPAVASVPVLARALSSMSRPVVLVLDDVHRLKSAPGSAVIDTLMMTLRGKSQVALSGRNWPSDSLAALRPTNRLYELGTDELAMGEEDARLLFQGLEFEVGEAEAKTLVDKTEGWPVGLWLAASSLRERGGDRKQAVASFAGDERSVTDYLSFELLTQTSRAQERFLERTAVLDRMSGPLCDAVLGTTGSAETLEGLERDNLLVVPLDRTRGWYRYHRLFREMLLHRLESRDHELARKLRLRAADQLERDGALEEAIGYAVAADDPDRVARIVAELALPTYAAGRLATLEGWLSWLETRGAIERHPPVAVIAAWLGALRGRPTDADRWTDAAERGSFSGEMPDGSSSIAPWLTLLRCMACRDGVQQMEHDARTALEGLAPGSPFRTAAMLKLGIARWLAGDTSSADAEMQDTIEFGLEHGAKGPVCIAMAERVLFAIERGDWAAAGSLADVARSFVDREGLDGYLASAIVYAASARVELHRGEIRRAQAELARGQRLRPLLTRAIPYLAVQTRLELAHVLAGLSDPSGARTLLLETADILRRRPGLGVLVDQEAELRAQLRAVSGGTPGASALTSAELRLLPSLPTYLSFREIGEQLHLSPHTVKTQAISIYRKLGVTSRAGAIGRAAELGLLPP
jgi:LuxR family maltose regulon positive regulatory protein